LTPLPTFVVIGAQKSATRWLRTNLGKHPDVYTAAREIVFFSSAERFERGEAWYREQFEGWDGERVVGEASPAYMMWRHRPAVVADRMHGTLGDVPLVAILRNPVDRARSAFVHHLDQGRVPAGTALLEHVRACPPEQDRLGIVSGGWYAASLRPYRERFGDRLLVLLHDDLGTDAAGIYRTTLRHVGADESFVPPALDRVRFSIRARDGESEAAELSPAERAELSSYFRDDVTQLEELLGRDLSMWDPAGGATDAQV
jgi:hypothetical protein